MGSRVAGKCAVVTGGSRGVGKVIASKLVAEGARVIITDIKAELGQQSAAETGAQFYEQDVSKPEAWSSLVEHVEKQFGRLDILINNAAIIHTVDLANETLEGWHRMMRVNADSVFLGITSCLPLMEKSGGGSIVNMSSSSALMGYPQFAAYGASKAAVRGITMSTAVHCVQAKNNVRCNSVHPDGINTDMQAEATADLEIDIDPVLAERAFAFFSEPEDIADVLLFLASDESRKINGAAITVDNSSSVHTPY